MDFAMDSAKRIPVRIGVPFRTLEEERAGEAKSKKLEYYYRAIRQAGAEPVPISLAIPSGVLIELCSSLDGFALTGSPSDVNPTRYHEERHRQTAVSDAAREKTDGTLIYHALAAGKPVLGICYGNQLINVYFGGTLIQDIPSELPQHLQHAKRDGETHDPAHTVKLEPGSRVAGLAGATEARVNSSHHQSVREPGRNLRVTAHAPDGVIEALEWTGDSNWIVGVQWHPERMEGDPFAAAIFSELVAAARHATVKS
jgi:putative glutamine amidotransferase